MKKLFRGISNQKLKQFNLKGIPTGTEFTSDVFTARKFGKNVISVGFTKTKFKSDKNSNNVFRRLKIKERYYKTKKSIKRFTKLMFLK